MIYNPPHSSHMGGVWERTPAGDFNDRDISRTQWRHEYNPPANRFGICLTCEDLPTVQRRRRWNLAQRNMCVSHCAGGEQQSDNELMSYATYWWGVLVAR